MRNKLRDKIWEPDLNLGDKVITKAKEGRSNVGVISHTEKDGWHIDCRQEKSHKIIHYSSFKMLQRDVLSKIT